MGGEFAHVGKFKDMPDDPRYPVAVEDKERIMHISYVINENASLMGSDTGGEWAKGFTQGNNFSISINAESREEADKIFNGLSIGGKVIIPMNKTFWESYFGMFTDKFGIQWMVSFDEMNKKK